MTDRPAKIAWRQLLQPAWIPALVVMLGGISARHDVAGRLAFWGGGSLASATFFYVLGYGARLLAPVFARPGAWRVFDIVIGLVMWAIAGSLLAGLA